MFHRYALVIFAKFRLPLYRNLNGNKRVREQKVYMNVVLVLLVDAVFGLASIIIANEPMSLHSVPAYQAVTRSNIAT